MVSGGYEAVDAAAVRRAARKCISRAPTMRILVDAEAVALTGQPPSAPEPAPAIEAPAAPPVGQPQPSADQPTKARSIA